MKDKEPEVKLRFNYYKQKYDIKLSDVFETPSTPIIEVPEDWISQVNVHSYAAPNYGQGHNRNRSVDHLKKYQFKPGGVTPSGERSGPGMHRLDLGDNLFSDIHGGAGMGFQEGIPSQLTSNPPVPRRGNAEQTSALTEKHSGNLFEGEDIDLENLGQGDGFPPAAQGSLGDDEYALIAIQYGSEAADAMALIGDCMTALSGKQELLSTTISDMFQLMENNEQLTMIKELYRTLPWEEQSRLAESGM